MTELVRESIIDEGIVDFSSEVRPLIVKEDDLG